MKKKFKGFTLVELIVVIAIIGVLAAILVPSLTGYVKKSNLQAANSSAKTAYTAIASYVTDQEVAGKPLDTVSGSIINVASYSTADPGVEKVVYDALGENGSGAGSVYYSIVSGKIEFVQWCKITTDSISDGSSCVIGQYPDGPASVDELKNVTWGKLYTASGS